MVTPADPVRTTVGFIPASAFAGGGVTDGANVGGEVEAFKAKNGTILEFRTFRGVNGIGVSQVGDVVEIDGAGSPTQSASFNDDTNLALVVGDETTDGAISILMSLFSPPRSRQSTYQLVLGVGPGNVGPAPDWVCVDSTAPVDTVTPTVQISGTDVELVLNGSGAGEVVEVRYQVRRIARL